MNRNYRYRLYPNRAQRAALDRVLEIHRQLYNAALQERREAWKKCRISISYYDQSRQIKAIRQFDPDAAWLNFTSIQQTLRRLDKAFAAFFQRIKTGQTPGYPRYKSRRRFTAVDYRWGDGAGLRANRLHVQNVGTIKVKWHRPLPGDATIKYAYLKRDGAQWYVLFSLELPDPQPGVHPGPAIGLDVGISSLVALSDGRLIENPRWYQAAEDRLANAQQVLCRREKYSRRWRKQAAGIARLHKTIANQRQDHIHKLSRQLASTYSLIAVEKLNVPALSRSALAKPMQDAGWGQLFSQLAYKVEETGSRLVEVDPRHTSQRCSRCGGDVPKELRVRVHACPACGLILDRDVNAARNILALAICSNEARTEPSALAPRSRRTRAVE